MNGTGAYNGLSAYQQDGSYAFVPAKIGASNTTTDKKVVVGDALVIIGRKKVQLIDEVITLPNTAAAVHKLYVNPDGAKDAQGNALARLSLVPEASSDTHVNPNGDVGFYESRSRLIAEITVVGNLITKVDCTVQLKLINVTPATHTRMA